jgi:hypothetical protein
MSLGAISGSQEPSGPGATGSISTNALHAKEIAKRALGHPPTVLPKASDEITKSVISAKTLGEVSEAIPEKSTEETVGMSKAMETAKKKALKKITEERGGAAAGGHHFTVT